MSYIQGWPKHHCIHITSDLRASPSQVLGLQLLPTTAALCKAGDRTQGFMCVKEALCQLSRIPKLLLPFVNGFMHSTSCPWGRIFHSPRMRQHYLCAFVIMLLCGVVSLFLLSCVSRMGCGCSISALVTGHW